MALAEALLPPAGVPAEPVLRQRSPFAPRSAKPVPEAQALAPLPWGCFEECRLRELPVRLREVAAALLSAPLLVLAASSNKHPPRPRAKPKALSPARASTRARASRMISGSAAARLGVPQVEEQQRLAWKKERLPSSCPDAFPSVSTPPRRPRRDGRSCAGGRRDRGKRNTAPGAARRRCAATHPPRLQSLRGRWRSPDKRRCRRHVAASIAASTSPKSRLLTRTLNSVQHLLHLHPQHPPPVLQV